MAFISANFDVSISCSSIFVFKGIVYEVPANSEIANQPLLLLCSKVHESIKPIIPDRAANVLSANLPIK